MNDSEIKSLTPIECPNCHSPLVVEFTTNAPKLSGVYTPEMIEGAKKEALDRIAILDGLSEEVTKPVIDWIKSPDTIFGPNDVDEILKNLEKQGDHEQEEEA